MTGRIVVLNGAPRSGKTSIAQALQSSGPWQSEGVDSSMLATPADDLPGIGLRPGGERPDLEPYVEATYLALYATVAAHARAGIDVVVDVGHHDDYSRPLHLLPRIAARLAGLPAWLIGVHCPIYEIMRRRDASSGYLRSEDAGPVPPEVARWQTAVHDPGIYDLEVDTSVLTPEACAAEIVSRLASQDAPTAFAQLATLLPD